MLSALLHISGQSLPVNPTKLGVLTVNALRTAIPLLSNVNGVELLSPTPKATNSLIVTNIVIANLTGVVRRPALPLLAINALLATTAIIEMYNQSTPFRLNYTKSTLVL